MPHPDWIWGPPSHHNQCASGALSQAVKWLEHEADSLPPSTAEDKAAVTLQACLHELTVR
jgi:hypothetical protein